MRQSTVGMFIKSKLISKLAINHISDCDEMNILVKWLVNLMSCVGLLNLLRQNAANTHQVSDDQVSLLS